MLRINRLCKSCLQIQQENKADPKKSPLYKLVDQYHLKGCSIQDIADQYEGKLTYHSIRTHALKHQHPNAKKLTEARIRATTTKASQDLLIKQAHHSERRTKLLDWIEEQIDAGNVKPTASAIVALLKQEADIEAKKTDQGLEILKMLTASRSGEFGAPKQFKPFDPWEGIEEGELVDGTATPTGE